MLHVRLTLKCLRTDLFSLLFGPWDKPEIWPLFKTRFSRLFLTTLKPRCIALDVIDDYDSSHYALLGVQDMFAHLRRGEVECLELIYPRSTPCWWKQSEPTKFGSWDLLGLRSDETPSDYSVTSEHKPVMLRKYKDPSLIVQLRREEKYRLREDPWTEPSHPLGYKEMREFLLEEASLQNQADRTWWIDKMTEYIERRCLQLPSDP